MATKRKRRKRPAGRSAPRPAKPAATRDARTPPPGRKAAAAAAASRPPTTSRRARLEDAPKAPWSPFPLVELTILAGIVLVVLGFVGVADDRVAFIVCGLALISVASLELSLREHFAGFRSHSSLLAGAAALIVVVVAQVVVDPPHLALIVAGVLVFGGCFALLRRAFRRRTGGIGFRA